MTNPGNMFDCNTDIYMYFLTLIVRKKRRYTVLRQGNGKDCVIKRGHLASRNSAQWFVAQKTRFCSIGYIGTLYEIYLFIYFHTFNRFSIVTAREDCNIVYLASQL